MVLPVIFLMNIFGTVARFVVFIPVKISEVILYNVYDDYELLDFDDLVDDPIEFVKLHTMVVLNVLRNSGDYFSSSPFILI